MKNKSTYSRIINYKKLYGFYMYKNKKIYLLSFFSFNLYPTSLRFLEQANEFNIFDNIFLYNEYTLPKDEQFDNILKSKLNANIRGFGYWCWKPFIVLKTLENIEYGDILVYADIGCHLSKNGMNRFYEYLDTVIENNSMCAILGTKEKTFTKADLFNYFNKLDDKNITDTCQRPATFFILEKTDKNIDFVKKWLQVFYDDFSLVDDSPSKIPNFEGFMENRHDQSVFSVLSKIYELKAITSYEFDSKDYKYPILFMRDKKDIYDFIIDKTCGKSIKKISWFISSFEKRETFRKYIKLNLKQLIIIYFTENKDFKKFNYTGCNNLLLDILIKLSIIKLKKELISGIKKNKGTIEFTINKMNKYTNPFQNI